MFTITIIDVFIISRINYLLLFYDIILCITNGIIEILMINSTTCSWTWWICTLHSYTLTIITLLWILTRSWFLIYLI